MTNMPHNPPRPIRLECGHTLWLKIPPHRLDEILWCTSCKAEQEIAPASAKLPDAWVIHADMGFRSRRVGTSNRYQAECLETDCDYVWEERRGWFRLETHMNEHYMRQHTRFGGRLDITIEPRLSRNSPPPF